jgi:3-hydroxyisobutyrate dehydrogenase-like beta-hydroxyacid dehydrogenase
LVEEIMNVGFIGLGNMGEPMARGLIKDGHRIGVYNRTRSRAEKFRREGAIVVGTPLEASRNEVVITMLSDDRAVEETVFGADGILSAALPGVIHVSMSTISVSLSARLTEAHAAAGQQYVAAPVFGRPAAAAQLTIIAAGIDHAVERCRPIFESLGQKTFVVGDEPSSANLVKLAGNFLIASAVESLGEAFTLARKSGIDPGQFLEILTGSLFPAPVYKTYGGLIAQGKYEPPGFKLSLGLKDVNLALAAAQSRNAPMPVASLIRDRLTSAIARGYGDLDLAALTKVCSEDAEM